MKDLVVMKNEQAVTTSLMVAEVFGKKHKHVLEAIDELVKGVAEKSADLFYEDTYTHPQNKQTYRQVIMNRDGFTLLAMGFTGKEALKFKMNYIQAFNEMERKIEEKPKLPTTTREVMQLLLKNGEEANERIDKVEEDIKQLKEEAKLDTGDYNVITTRVKKRVYEVARSYGWANNKEAISVLFKDINSGIKRIAHVEARTQLQVKHYEQVMDFINNWEPSVATRYELKQTKLDV